MSDFQVGDKVTFSAGSGRKQTGIITGSREKTFRGKRKQLAEMFGGPKSCFLFTVKTADDRIWSCPPSILTLVERASVAPAEAFSEGRELLAKIKSHNARIRHVRQTINFGTIETEGLDSLRIGEDIEVQFRNRFSKRLEWCRAKFLGIVPSSGRVRFEYVGRTLTTSPQFVRVPASN